jgi:hypothetical protein
MSLDVKPGRAHPIGARVNFVMCHDGVPMYDLV